MLVCKCVYVNVCVWDVLGYRVRKPTYCKKVLGSIQALASLEEGRDGPR